MHSVTLVLTVIVIITHSNPINNMLNLYVTLKCLFVPLRHWIWRIKRSYKLLYVKSLRSSLTVDMLLLLRSHLALWSSRAVDGFSRPQFGSVPARFSSRASCCCWLYCLFGLGFLIAMVMCWPAWTLSPHLKSQGLLQCAATSFGQKAASRKAEIHKTL